MTSDPTTLPGADGHRTSVDHLRTAEMHAACALALLRSSDDYDYDQAQFIRHMRLAELHNNLAATIVAGAGLVSPEHRRGEVNAWTELFADRAKRAENRPASRVRGTAL